MTIDVASIARTFGDVLAAMGAPAPRIGRIEPFSGCAARADVSARLELAGDPDVRLVIAASAQAAARIASAIVGTPVEPGSPLVADALGELLNVVAGMRMREAAWSLSLPVISCGPEHPLDPLEGESVELAAFEPDDLVIYFVRRPARLDA